MRRGSLFLSWILKDGAGTNLWPSKEECIENVVRNDIMALCRDGTLLVRFAQKHQTPLEFAHLPDLCVQADGSAGGYACAIYTLTSDNFADLDDDILPRGRGIGLIEFAKRALKIRSCVREFSSKHFGASARFVNVFGTETRLERATLAPQAPFSGLGDFLIFKDAEAAPNNAEFFDENVWRWIVTSGETLIGRAHAVEVEAANVEQSLVPFRRTATKLEALGDLVARVGPGDLRHAPPSRAELLKCAMIFSVLGRPDVEGLDGRATTAPRCDRFLECYLSLRERNKYQDRVLFDPTGAPRRTTLEELYLSVSNSIDRFQAAVGGDQGDFGICGELRERLYALDSAARILLGDLSISFPSGPIEVRACTLEFDPDEQTLMVDGGDIRGLGGEQFVARLGQLDVQFRPIAMSDVAELAHAEGRAFRFQQQGVVLFVLASAPVLSAWQAIERRNRDHEAGKLKSESVATACDPWKRIEVSTHFKKAREVVRANLGDDDHGRATARLCSWMEMFEPSVREGLLEVIAAHHPITRENIDALFTNIETLYRNEEDVVFTVKSPNDFGGVHRLFGRRGDLFRRLGVAEPVKRIVEIGRSGVVSNHRRLIVPHDLGIGGGQVANAFAQYYLKPNISSEVQEKAEKWHLHPLTDSTFSDFRKGLLSFAELCFVFGRYTPDAEKRIRSALEPHYPADRLKFVGSVIGDGTHTLQNATLVHSVREAFLELLRNKGSIEERFEVPSDREADVKRDRDEPGNINLVVRVHSVPKWTAQIFTLQPKNHDVSPLFERIYEHQAGPRR